MKTALQTFRTLKWTILAVVVMALVGAGIVTLPGQFRRLQQHTTTSALPTVTATAPLADALVPPAAQGKWRPIFSESFNGAALDTAHWSTCFWWVPDSPNGCEGATGNGEIERYMPQNVTVHDGALDIVAKREHLAIDNRVYEYTAGIITTEGKVAFRYGYVEARVRMDPGKGIWPAVWLLPEDRSSTNEVDLAEILCNHPTVLNMAMHFQVNGVHHSVGSVYSGGDFSTGYHTIAIDWEPTSMTWYEDGKAVYQVSDPAKIPQKEMYIVLNTAVGGTWPGYPDGTTSFPHHFQVDWVQAWSRSAGARS